MIVEASLSGQKVIINDFNKVVKITIDSAFQDPSYVMKENWNFHCVGFGINIKIIALVLTKKWRLMVHHNNDNKDYIIEFNDLFDFITKHNVDYKVKETKLKILPITIFKVL